MAQHDKDDFVLPSRGALQRLKDDQTVDKEIDQQLSGLSTSSEYRARLAETSRLQLPGEHFASSIDLPSQPPHSSLLKTQYTCLKEKYPYGSYCW